MMWGGGTAPHPTSVKVPNEKVSTCWLRITTVTENEQKFSSKAYLTSKECKDSGVWFSIAERRWKRANTLIG